MITVPPDDCAAALSQKKIKFVIVGTGGRKQTIAGTAEQVANNDPQTAPLLLVIWAKTPANCGGVVPTDCDVAILDADNNVVTKQRDQAPNDLTDPIVINGLFNIGIGGA